MSKTLIFLIIILFSFESSIAHKQNVHQYIVKEAYKLLKLQFSLDNGFGDIDNWIGQMGDDKNTQKWSEVSSILGGAYCEDEHDPVFLYSVGGSNIPDWGFIEFLISITHFWDPDNPFKQTKVAFLDEKFPTAYKKSIYYVGGGWQMKIFDGNNILYCSSYPLAILYSRSSLYVEKYYNVLGQECGDKTWNCGETICKRLSYNILGRLCHLLADMSVPAHIHMDEHGVCDDWYENWLNIDRIYWNAENVYKERGGFINPGCDNPLLHQGKILPFRKHSFLWYTVAQIADYFASNREDGDDNYDAGSGEIESVLKSYAPEYPTQNIETRPCPTYSHTQEDLETIRDVTIPYVIRATAGLLFKFIIESKMLHPEYEDETFGSIYDQILELNLYDQIIAGNHYMFRAEGNPGKITVCPEDKEGDFVIEGTARNVTFRAANEIVFKDGFRAEKGSIVHAYTLPDCVENQGNPDCAPCLNEEQNPQYDRSID